MKKHLLLFAILFAFSSPSLAAENDEATPYQVEIWQKKATEGDAESQFNLADALQKGEGGLDQNEKEAAKWYYKSAIQGFTDAQFAMGFVCRGGNGIPMDKVLSYMWFDIAAKNGNDKAFGLRNDVAWSMTEAEIDEARKKSRSWKIGSLEGNCHEKLIATDKKSDKKTTRN